MTDPDPITNPPAPDEEAGTETDKITPVAAANLFLLARGRRDSTTEDRDVLAALLTEFALAGAAYAGRLGTELAALAFEVCRHVDRCQLYGPADHLRDAAARLKAKAVEFTGEKK